MFLREILTEDGSIYARINYHFGHYIKAIMDEVFEKQNFRNEIIVNRGYVPKGLTRQFLTGSDSFFFYARGISNLFNGYKKKIAEEDRKWISLDMPGERKTYEKQILYFFGKPILPPKGQHWALSQERISELEKRGDIRINPRRTYTDLQGKTVKGMPEYRKEPELLIKSNWTDIPSYRTNNTGYPTENSEELLDRIIKSSSNPGDLVLDCFPGSGKTLALAEKLGRRLIGAEYGKLVIYTMQKRLLNIAESKDLEDPKKKKKYGKPCKPFTLYNSGLYDYKMIKELPWEQYQDYALKHFQCRDERHEISKINWMATLARIASWSLTTRSTRTPS
uniref:DNA methyltransferase n=1 Tax=Candidatus Saccharicenans sp. TaxID=2819258 RepID=UPI004049BA81